VDGKPVETQRFRVEEQGQQVLGFEMHKGVLIDEAAVVSSFVELTKLFEKTFVNQFSQRLEGGTFDSGERKASRLRAAAKAQAADDGDATDEALALSVKCMRYGWIGHKSGSGFINLAPSILHYDWF
jgi:hypothetical protein